jgi:nucleoside-diphosphate-sugar epimerase
MRACALTGASGYVGTRVAAALAARGVRVVRLARRPSTGDAPFRLGEPLGPRALDGVDALVHCAYDFAPVAEAEIRRVNVDGSLMLLDAARAAGVPRIAFVSSIAAWDGCRSRYGRGKLEVERAVAAQGGVSLRPGLVWDAAGRSRGVFGALERAAALPLLPVFDGGQQPFFLAHVDDVAMAVVASLAWEPSSMMAASTAPVVAAHERAWTFVDLLRALAARRGRRARVVSVPGGAALAVLRAVELAGLPLRFRSDGLLSQLHPDPAPDFAPARALGLKFRAFDG